LLNQTGGYKDIGEDMEDDDRIDVWSDTNIQDANGKTEREVDRFRICISCGVGVRRRKGRWFRDVERKEGGDWGKSMQVIGS